MAVPKMHSKNPCSRVTSMKNLCSAVAEDAIMCHNRTVMANQNKTITVHRASVSAVMTGTQPIDQSKHSHVGFSSSHALRA